MAPQEFVMISAAFSDGVLLKKEGPLFRKEFSSELVLAGGKSYIAAATFNQKWKASHFVTTLTVGDELTYLETVLLQRRTEIQNYSESISVFPEDKVRSFRSVVSYDPNATEKRFVAGLKLLPAKKCVVTETNAITGKGDATECQEKNVNGDIGRCGLIKGTA